MADLVIPDNFAICTFIFALGGNSHQFSFSHAVDATPLALAGIQDVADDAAHAFDVGYGMANAYNSWLWVGVHALGRIDGVLVSADSIQNIQGTGGGGQVNTPNLSMIVKKSTAFAGRQYRGRMYWPCLSLLDADVNNSGTIDSTVLGVIDGNVQDFFTQWQAESSVNHLSLLHTDDTVDPTTVTAWSVEALCGTQRRRMR